MSDHIQDQRDTYSTHTISNLLSDLAAKIAEAQELRDVLGELVAATDRFSECVVEGHNDASFADELTTARNLLKGNDD